ncbi:MAG TPA: lysophospholipid acyltransferase family protein [Gemmatimonadales bacterium]
MRRLITAVLAALVRIFFRRVEIAGRENVPVTGPVILAGNHPNALIDPVMLLVHAGRPVSFMAKEPLFRTPVIGWLVRGLDSIPVYRRMDQADTRRNLATFTAARALLSAGGCIAIFPEGTSHSDPAMKPFRTGAARIALGAGAGGLVIVPVGLFYTAKTRFRSTALLCFGPPLQVSSTDAAPGEPAAGPVRDLTRQLEEALAALTVQADRHEALTLAEAAERILSSSSGEPTDLTDRLQLRQRLIAGYARLRSDRPDRLAAITSRITRYAASLAEADLTPERLPAHGYRAATVLRVTLRAVVVLTLLLPLALVGGAIHAPAWLLIDRIARHYERTSPDLVATVKALAGVLFYLLTWLIAAWWAGHEWGWGPGLGALAGAPVAGWAALRFLEEADRLIGGARGLLLAMTGRRRFLRLVAERDAIREELRLLGRTYGV